jgi:NitT/TauT family transport system permease protein
LKAGAAVLPLAATGGLIIAWQVAVGVWRIPAVLLPSPGAVVAPLIEEWPRLLGDAGVTCGEAVAAFGLAVAAGIGIAALMTLQPGTRQALQPHLVLFQLVPKLALGPLFITWFGLGWSSRIAFAMFVSVFPVALGALTGLARVDRSALHLLLACRASRWQVFRHLRLPSAAPYIFAGTKVAATMAFTGATVGEFLSAQSGLGYAILNAASVSDTPLIFSALLLLCALGAALYGAVAVAEAAVRRAMAEARA